MNFLVKKLFGEEISIRRFFSHDATPLAQFVKYGVIGVLATLVQTGIFYLAAALWFKCLTPDDFAVKVFGLPGVVFTGDEPWYAMRGMLAAIDTAIGFFFANVFCWLMNRWFVFKPGKFKWFAEFGMFFGAASLATVMALGTMKILIDTFGMMTTLAVFVEVLVSFLVNFFVRKFVIFKG